MLIESVTEVKLCGVLLKPHKVLMWAVFLEELCFWKSVEIWWEWRSEQQLLVWTKHVHMLSCFNITNSPFCPASEESTFHSYCSGKSELQPFSWQLFLCCNKLVLIGDKVWVTLREKESKSQCSAITLAYSWSSNKQKNKCCILQRRKSSFKLGLLFPVVLK